MGTRRVNGFCYDTTPGSGGLFAPPEPEVHYVRWLSRRFKDDPEVRQHIGILAHLIHHPTRHSPAATLTGPHADALRHFVARFDASLDKHRHAA